MPKDLDAKQLEALKRLLSVLDSSTPTRDEFTGNFKTIIDHVKKIDARNLKEIKAMHEALKKMVDNVKRGASDHIELTKKDVVKILKDEMDLSKSDIKKMSEMIDGKMALVQNGLDGKDADEERMIEEVLERVLEPTLSKMGENLPQLGKGVRDALELLTGDDRLDVSAIKGLDEFIKKGSKDGSAIVGGGGVSRNAVRYYDLSASLDGSTKTFTLPVFNRILDVKLSSVPVMRLTTDYTVDIANSTITFTSEITLNDLSAGQSLIVLYSE